MISNNLKKGIVEKNSKRMIIRELALVVEEKIGRVLVREKER